MIFQPYQKIKLLVEGIAFSIILIWLTTGLKIVLPTYVGWLERGDGTMEIAWEFFRNQPFFQFPLGLNPKYGLEISSTIAFDGNLPLFSILLKPFSFLLPHRFQYVGIFLLICFILNYIISKKIFLKLNLSSFNAALAAIIVSTHPIILFRFIESDHYGLIAAFLIFGAMYLVITSDASFIKWTILYVVSSLIFIYYTVFIAIIHFLFLAYKIKIKKESFLYILIKFISSISICLLIMYLIGFFYGNVSTADVGFGLFRSTLTSLIDSGNWSIILPNIGELEGAYEGFAYVGLSVIILMVFLFITKRNNNNEDLIDKKLFQVLWISSIVLFIFSLSNKIAFAKIELFEFTLPNQVIPLVSTFRSSGRFTWLLVFVLFFWLVYKISLKVSQNTLSIILLTSLILHFIDISGNITSQRNGKFANNYKTNLTHPAWNEIYSCYNNIRLYPPTVGLENSYNFINLANNQDLGINTGRFGRLNSSAINSAFELMQREFNTGVYRNDSFYVFTESEYVSPEIIAYHKNMAITTLSADSAYGELNGFTFIAPNLNLCQNKNRLSNNVNRFGVPETQMYKGQLIKFDNKRKNFIYALTGFSEFEDWGTWSLGELSKVTLNTTELSNFSQINIRGKDFVLPLNSIEVFLNGTKIGNCSFELNFSTCSLPFKFSNLANSIINLDFRPLKIRSPEMLNISEDTRNIGFGLSSISLS